MWVCHHCTIAIVCWCVSCMRMRMRCPCYEMIRLTWDDLSRIAQIPWPKCTEHINLYAYYTFYVVWCQNVVVVGQVCSMYGRCQTFASCISIVPKFFLKYSCHDLYNIESLWPHCLAVELHLERIGRRDTPLLGSRVSIKEAMGLLWVERWWYT